jgi:hypothetical protein
MNAHSNERPPKMADLGGRTLYSYDVVEVVENELISFRYKTLTVNGPVNRDKLIRALVSEKYSLEDEIALINNYLTAPAMHEQEYNQYQIYRNTCKTIATELIN